MKAVVLAGGFGKRLKPLTDDKPKPLLEVGGLPILGRQVNWLHQHGINDLILCTGYLKERIINYLGSGSKFGVKVGYAVEEEPLGTGGALKNAETLLADGEVFLVLNGDVITDLDPSKLSNAMDQNSVGAIAVVPLRSPYGIVDLMKDGRIDGFREKPVLPDYWINAGVYCFATSIFSYLPLKGDIEDTVFPKLSQEGKLKAIKYLNSFWKSIDSHKDIEDAEKELDTTSRKS